MIDFELFWFEKLGGKLLLFDNFLLLIIFFKRVEFFVFIFKGFFFIFIVRCLILVKEFDWVFLILFFVDIGGVFVCFFVDIGGVCFFVDFGGVCFCDE